MFCLEIYQREVPSPFFNSFICLHPSGKFAFPFYSNASILHVKLRYSEKATKTFLNLLKVSRSRNKIVESEHLPKTNERIYFSIQDRNTNSLVYFLGGVTARRFCFQIYWPLVTSKTIVNFFPKFCGLLRISELYCLLLALFI